MSQFLNMQTLLSMLHYRLPFFHAWFWVFSSTYQVIVNCIKIYMYVLVSNLLPCMPWSAFFLCLYVLCVYYICAYMCICEASHSSTHLTSNPVFLSCSMRNHYHPPLAGFSYLLLFKSSVTHSSNNEIISYIQCMDADI